MYKKHTKNVHTHTPHTHTSHTRTTAHAHASSPSERSLPLRLVQLAGDAGGDVGGHVLGR